MSPSSPQDRPAPDQPYAPHPPYPPPPTSGLAVASLVTGVVCCVPPLGLVLGLLALHGIRRTGRRGRGMAVAGIALSSVSTLLVSVALAVGPSVGGLPALVDELRHGGDGSASVHRLERGICFDQPGGASEEQEVAAITEVPCDEPHDAEVTGTFRLDGSAYPGVERIERQAEQRCGDLADAYAMDAWAVPRTPSSSTTTPPRRVGATSATARSPACSPRPGQADGVPAQRRHHAEPGPAGVSHGGQPRRRGLVRGARGGRRRGPGRQHRLGRAHGEGAGHRRHRPQGPPLRRRRGEARGRSGGATGGRGPALGAAAAAKDPDTYWERYDAAYGSLPADFGREARKALNLATTQTGGQEAG